MDFLEDWAREIGAWVNPNELAAFLNPHDPIRIFLSNGSANLFYIAKKRAHGLNEPIRR
jgi:hypothetical protein